MSSSPPTGIVERAPARTVFLAFLKLGLASFGGPIAHLGYFRAEFVERRRWIDDRTCADLVALCQFLPGPAPAHSSSAAATSFCRCCGRWRWRAAR